MNMQFGVMSKLLKSLQPIIYIQYLLLITTVLILYFGLFDRVLYYVLISLSTLICLIQHYISIRVQLDAEILHLLYLESDQHDDQILAQRLDDCLLSLNLIKTKPENRLWAERFRGCKRLMQYQVAILIAQVIVFIFVLLI